MLHITTAARRPTSLVAGGVPLFGAGHMQPCRASAVKVLTQDPISQAESRSAHIWAAVVASLMSIEGSGGGVLEEEHPSDRLTTEWGSPSYNVCNHRVLSLKLNWPNLICNLKSNPILSQPCRGCLCIGACCRIILFYTVKICHLSWFKETLISQQPGRKHRRGYQTKDDGKERAE